MATPERDSLWDHPMYRGTWRVKSAGRKWVTLASTFPLHLYLNTTRVHVDDWPERWTPVAPDAGYRTFPRKEL